MVDTIPADAIGLTLAHHGLVVWGEDAEECTCAPGAGGRQIEEYIAADVARRRRPPG